MIQDRDWYTITELAQQIDMSRKTVWAWVRDGKLKSIRYGSQHRISESEWNRFLVACNRPENKTNDYEDAS
jgi:excisionase family DNA binding protein